MIINMTGGSVALNFKILGGTTAPDSPKENTIWVNTDTSITSWAVMETENASPVEGMVWIKTGTLTSAEFNALKKNALEIRPVMVYQYVGGAWVFKTASIYQGGGWRNLEMWLIKEGRTPYPLVAVGKGRNSVYSAAWSSASATPTEDTILVKGNAAGYGIAYFDGIDLTGYNTLTIEGTFTFNGSDPYRLAVWSSLDTYYETNLVSYAALTSTGATLDVSDLSGTYVVGIISAGTNAQNIENLWLS